MAKLRVELVTAEGRVLSQDADFVLAPGSAGDLGVLPNHIPLLTPLRTGEVLVRSEGSEDHLFVAGGFLEVVPEDREVTKVVILADVAERAEEIDEQRAEEARREAQELLAQQPENPEAALALEHAMFRLRVAEVRRRRHDRGGGSPGAQ